MFNLEIDRLRLTIRNMSGQEHRVAPIAERAMALLSERMGERTNGRRPAGGNVDLSTLDDEQAASHIADLCLDALALRL